VRSAADRSRFSRAPACDRSGLYKNEQPAREFADRAAAADVCRLVRGMHGTFAASAPFISHEATTSHLPQRADCA
jgi:hypothetical protein